MISRWTELTKDRLQEASARGRPFVVIGGLMGLYAGEAVFGNFRFKDPKERLNFFIRNVSKYSAWALREMNFDIEIKGFDAQMMAERNFLIVTNHMSYVDILVMSSIMPSVFVTSVDMGEVFFLGTMAELGGSIFIERRHREKINQDIAVMAETLKDGFHVVMYPEGTSSNGQQILPFKKGLLMSAVRAGRDILPVCLKYTEIDGKPFSPDNADKVCWYGDMDFASHILQLLRVKSIKAELHFLDPIKVTSESTPNELAAKSYAAIDGAFHYQSLSLVETDPADASAKKRGKKSDKGQGIEAVQASSAGCKARA